MIKKNKQKRNKNKLLPNNNIHLSLLSTLLGECKNLVTGLFATMV